MNPEINRQTSISILFVEDDELILDIQSSLLKARFPEVAFYTAVNGRVGLELFTMHKPEIIITDINMPEMCGVEMSHAIRAINPDTTFITITGKSGKIIKQYSGDLEFEFDHVVSKPVDLSELFAVVELCIGGIV